MLHSLGFCPIVAGRSSRSHNPMLNRPLLEFLRSPNNGRQVARLNDGRWLLLTHSEIMGPAELRLLMSRNATPPSSLKDFEDVGRLVGPNGKVPGSGPWGLGGCIVVVGETLHLAWTGPHGIQVSRARVKDKPVWNRARTIREGDCCLGDLFATGQGIALTWQHAHDRGTESVGLSRGDAGWRSREFHRGRPMFAPVADTDERGRIHFAWGDTTEQLRYTRIDKPQAKADVQLLGPGRQPTILCVDDQVLIVAESDMGHLRYYFRSANGQWQKHLPLTMTDPWLTSDENHSPGLTRDQYGVAWLFFSNNTRQSTFWARWMGDRWSDVVNGPRIYFRRARFDANLLPIGRLSVEKRSSQSAKGRGKHPSHDFGLLLTCEPPIRRIDFRRETGVELKPPLGQRTLFLDMLEVARCEHVTLQVETAVKHANNPLMQRGPVGAFDQDRVFNHGRVMLDGDRYRMWYAGLREPRRGERHSPWYDWIQCGYAESKDGLSWKRVRVGTVSRNGSRDNNLLQYLRHSPVIFRDDGETNPKRRYKAFYFWNSGEHLEIARTGKYGKKWDPRDEHFLVDVLTSPDGIHFNREEGKVVFPGDQAKPLSVIPQCVFRDTKEPDPQKRFKAYGFTSLNLRRRGASLITSPDCVHWTAHPELPLIDPAIRGTPPAVGGPTGQVHDTVCFPYEGYYVALYQDQHDPRNMPVELAVSRDSEWFRHVKPGQKVIPVGKPDEWDALVILPTIPVFLKREIRLYYGGGSERRELGGGKRWQTLPGLATLRRDGFTSIRLADRRTPGTLTTIPCHVPDKATRLHVNVNCPKGAEIRIDLIDARTNKPIAGYSAEACQPVTGDHLDTTIRWRDRPSLPHSHRTVVLSFHLRAKQGTPRLFSFWFTKE